jgi:hypothetical protein
VVIDMATSPGYWLNASKVYRWTRGSGDDLIEARWDNTTMNWFDRN